ncbi:hypothetical protein [Oryzobacter terrae]|uniref:hypothetical protein n=1 Tax=Oryzobacter terrae TaxID=1620385 RepID=UPI00366B6587
MEVPQHWVRVEGWSPHLGSSGGPLAVWGWSTESDEEAAEVGRRRLAETLDRVALEGRLPATRGYYPRTPLREPVLEEVLSDDGRRLGVVTRNRMGCEVLCTDLLLIADVDVDGLDEGAASSRGRGGRGGRGAGAGVAGFLRRLVLGRPDPPPQQTGAQDAAGLDSPSAGRPGGAHGMFSAGSASPVGSTGGSGPTVAEALACEPVWEFARANPDLGVRVYRTAAGLRVLVSGAAAGPLSDRARAILVALDSDPLYVELCATHDSYRARLTPKPHRLGEPALGVSWPCADEAAERAWLRWVDAYDEAVESWATCRLISASGAVPGVDEQRLIDLHDERTRVRERLPLA